MREQDKLRMDRYRGRSEGEGLRLRDSILRITIYAVAVSLLFVIGMLAAPAVSSAQVAVGVSVSFAPPALPVYTQPPWPGPGYIWIPGYWAWDPDIGYYWVPGTWVLAPFEGALWTPGYWGWSNGVFVWYPGYWGLVVGFYGGINYGFGYTGYGYHGGYWDHGAFHYNRAVNNINVTNVNNVYSRAVGPVTSRGVSYNGGRGGITLHPTAAQLAAAHERHSQPTSVQLSNERAARGVSGLRAAVNHGRPAIAATARPGVFTGSGVVRASRAGAPYKAPSGLAAAPGAVAPHHGSSIERNPRVTGPEHAAPPARMEREPRHVPEHRGVAGPQNAPRPAPHRPDTEHPG